MRNKRDMRCGTGVMAALLLAATLAGMPTTPAWATLASGDVHGMDSWRIGADAGEGIDVLTVTGAPGERLYLELTQGGASLGSHLPYTLSGEGNSLVGVVSLDMAYDPTLSYGIRAYNSRTEAADSLVYEGTIKTVCGVLCDDAAATEGETVPLVVRTLAAGEDRPLDLPATLAHDGATYQLAGELAGTPRYVRDATGIAEQVEGKVCYYRLSDNALLKETSFTISEDEGSKLVDVDDVVVGGDGAYYRSLTVTGSVTARYPGITEFSVMCVPLSGDWGARKPYTARFAYVASGSGGTALGDQTGAQGSSAPLINLLDSLIVTKDYTYVPPAMVYVKRDGVVQTWVLETETGLQTDRLVDGAIRLAPSDTGDDQTIAIAYRLAGDDTNARWTVRCLNGAVGAGSPDRLLQITQYDVLPDTSETFEVPQTLEGYDADGNLVTMVPVSGTEPSYTYTYDGANLVLTTDLYYVPADYVEEQSYDVTLRLVDVATGAQIKTQAYPMTPDRIAERDSLVLTAQDDFPASFAQAGTTYVRLDGQAADISHAYYNYDTTADGTRTKTYTVYYRDEADDLHANTTISTVRTVYDTVFVDRGVMGSDTVAPGASTAALTNDGGLTAISTGDGSTTLVRDDGTNVTDERIDDGENPLTPPYGGQGDAVEQGPDDQAPAPEPAEPAPPSALKRIGSLLGALLGVAAGWLFFGFRRKAHDEDETDARD